jgi:hypothetical protein
VYIIAALNRAQKTLSFPITKTNQLKLYKEIISVVWEIYKGTHKINQCAEHRYLHAKLVET